LQENPDVFGNGDATAELPADFPRVIPRYPDAILLEVGLNAPRSSDTDPDGTGSSETQPAPELVQTRWQTADPPDQIREFYRSQLQDNGWRLDASSEEGVISARRDDLTVTLEILATPTDVAREEEATSNAPADSTDFLLSYQADRSRSRSPSSDAQQPLTDSWAQSPPADSSSPSPSPTPAAPVNFTDLDEAPPELRVYIEDLARLGTFQDDPGARDQFNPNEPISRRDYARWLLTTNNRLFRDRPSDVIRLAGTTEQPAFQDVPTRDPDFAIIQGLADAGLIPSPLVGDSTIVNFRPDAPLTREELIRWKVPLDVRRALPNATVDAVKETWGFQDAAQIDPAALRAVLADFQNGDRANIRRAFGFTTLFQPDKPVTRAEAAAVLWYFGYQSDGISVQDAL
jgi:hypothetical protein